MDTQAMGTLKKNGRKGKGGILKTQNIGNSRGSIGPFKND